MSRAMGGEWWCGWLWSVMDWVRGVWMSQDWRSEEHTKASELPMPVMD
jgi:hypothetical protein